MPNTHETQVPRGEAAGAQVRGLPPDGHMQTARNRRARQSFWSALGLVLLLPIALLVRHETPARQAPLELLWLILAAAAVILGVLGTQRALDSNGRGVALASIGLAIGVMGLIAWLPLHNYFKHLRFHAGLRQLCADRLLTYGAALRASAKDRGQFPAKFSEFYREHHRNLPAPRCPTRVDHLVQPLTLATEFEASLDDPDHSQNSYVYCGAGLSIDAPGGSILLCEKPSNHGDGSNVLYADGHVEWVDAAAARVLLDSVIAKESRRNKGDK